jgi:phage gp29-like protein
VLGNTLTTEASETGTQALGTVHSKVEEALFLKDLRFVLNVLNYDMTDIFESLASIPAAASSPWPNRRTRARRRPASTSSKRR